MLDSGPIVLFANPNHIAFVVPIPANPWPFVEVQEPLSVGKVLGWHDLNHFSALFFLEALSTACPADFIAKLEENSGVAFRGLPHILPHPEPEPA